MPPVLSRDARVEGGAVPVGFCGLEAMGSAITERLLAQGHRLTVWNRIADRAAALVRRGASQATTSAGVAASSDLEKNGRPRPRHSRVERGNPLNPEYAPAYWPAASHERSSTVCKRHWLTAKCTLNFSILSKGFQGSGVRTEEIERTMTGGAERPFVRIWHIADSFPRPAAITSGFLHHFCRVTVGQVVGRTLTRQIRCPAYLTRP